MENLASLIRLVLLTVDGQTYALHLEAVERIVRMVEVTLLPGAPDVVEGVINIQGEAIQSGFAEELLRARGLKSPLGEVRARADLARR